MPSSHRQTAQRGRPLQSNLISCGFSHADVQMLQMARHMFQSFACPQTQSWMQAIELADLFHEEPGHQILHNLLSFVQAVRCTRQSCFQFSNPRCINCSQIVTAHERQFMSCLKAAKCGQFDKAESHAYLLCEGNDTKLAIAALRNFAPIEAATAVDKPRVKLG